MNNGKAKLFDRENKKWFKNRIESALFAQNDVHRKQRIKEQECPYCFYLASGFGGSAMTSWECALCPKSQVFGSTSTPTLCDECAKKEDRCKQCGDKMFETK